MSAEQPEKLSEHSDYHHEEEEEHTHYHGVDKAEEHITVAEALKLVMSKLSPITPPELVPLSQASHRVLALELKARSNIPALGRSTRDGFAVRVGSSTAPHSFAIVGDVRIGVLPKKVLLKEGEAVRIATGSYLPKGTDAVVMKEYATVAEEARLLSVARPIKKGENMLGPGEDVSRGQLLLTRGTMLRAQHVALLSMLGERQVRVFRRPRIAFTSTGDELVDLRKKKKQATAGIYDVNRPFIGSMLQELGAQPCDLGIARDNFQEIKAKIFRGLKTFDGLILSAGSSVGERDYVALAAASIKGIRTLVHGVAMRPSSPTGLLLYQERKPFVLLPGFPTSAIVSFYVFCVPILLKLSGRGEASTPYPIVRARLQEDFQGKAGVRHFLRVKVTREPEGRYTAEIVKPTEAYYSRWLAQANGIAIVEEDRGPLATGEEVQVMLIGNE